MLWKNCCSSRMVFIWTVVVGLLFGGSLFLAFWGMPRIIKSQIHSQTKLTNGTEQWDRFVELPFKLDFKIRFFNVTNEENVKNGEIPNLEETEPYNYKLSIKKTNLRFDDIDEDSVTYKRELSFEFDKSSGTRETDNVTVINPLLMAALQITSSIQRLALAGCIDKLLKPSGLDTLFITTTVKQLLFDGIEFAHAGDDVGVACEIVRQQLIKIVEPIRVIEPSDHSGNPDHLKIAIFNYKTTDYINESPDGIYTINRGIDDMTALGNILRWNGLTRINTYGNAGSTNNDTCQAIRGTDSTIYSPMIKSDQKLIIYNTDICRTVELTHTSSDETYNGIKAFKFETSKMLFRPETDLPENDCFCSKATKDLKGKDNCYLDGLLDFRPCLGAPALVSQPHFLNADDHYRLNFSGLTPDESKHGIYLLIEPNTGTPLEGMKRIQINSLLRHFPLISPITPKEMYEGVVPILWLEEGFSLPAKYVDILNKQYFKKVHIATGVKYGLIATFASLFAACLFIVWRKECFKNKKN